MGILANHVPSIEQLKPGLVEVIEESGGSKQFFRMCEQRTSTVLILTLARLHNLEELWPKLMLKLLFLVSGGFAIVQPGSQLSINAVEGFPLEDFSPEVWLFCEYPPYVHHC